MARGPKPNPELARYQEHGYVPAIYVMEADGAVKVGQATAISRRLCHLHSALRRRGVSVGRFAVFHQPCVDLYRAEHACINALRAAAQNVGRSREYFTGITYDAALEVVRETLGCLPLTPSVPR